MNGKDERVVNEVTNQKIERKIEDRKKGLPDFVIEFAEYLESDYSLQTQLEYIKDIQLFLEYLLDSKTITKEKLKELSLDDLKEITAENIQDFLSYVTNYSKEFISVGGNITIQKFANGPRGKERKRASLQRFFQYFVEQNQLPQNPVEPIKIKVKKYSTKPHLVDQELHRMFDIAIASNPDPFRGFRNRVILKVLAYTGIRISELTNLNLSDVSSSRNELVITRNNGEKDYFFIHPDIRGDLYQYLEKRREIKNIQKGHKEALFLSQQMRRLDPRSVRKMIRKIATITGMNIPVTPNTFRRTFGWKHYQEHQDLELTTELLGNRSISTTRHIYAHTDETHAQRGSEVH